MKTPQQVYRERLMAEGLCINCAKSPTRPGKRLCETCAERQNATLARRRKSLRLMKRSEVKEENHDTQRRDEDIGRLG